MAQILTERVSELEALNVMLSTIGGSPITNVENPQNVDALSASNTLRTALREVQCERWYFNTEDNYPLAVDTQGEIKLPSNLISIDASGRFGETLNVVIRGDRLYDRVRHTFQFPSTLYVNVQWCLSFDELPETAKMYVLIKAARIFQETQLGDPNLRSWTLEDEMRARGNLVSEDLAQRKLAFGALPRLDPNVALDFRDM